MTPGSSTVEWSGEQGFLLVGTDCYSDLLRIKSTAPKGTEMPLRLTLPTLCITYADMEFANAIGGEQEPYPASQSYGPLYFDPPVVLNGESDVEKFTWIRGAHQVVIGPQETVIEWYPKKTLIIPRLRLDRKTPTTAVISVEDAWIPVDQPLVIKVMQYADGRHIGGICVVKRHPDWKPTGRASDYELWVRVVNGFKGWPIREARLHFFHWDRYKATPFGQGGFELVDVPLTDGDGVVQDLHRPSGELEAVTLDLPGWRAVARCFRPLGGQHVRLFVRAWPLKAATVRYIWRQGDSLDWIAPLTGRTAEYILRTNRLKDPSELKPGMDIRLPCYAATYRMEPGDTFEWLAEAFGYKSVKELAQANRVHDPAAWDGSADIVLPGWHFFYARQEESLPRLDEMFRLPPGSVRTVGRVHHADPRLPYEGEVIAVPTAARARLLGKDR